MKMLLGLIILSTSLSSFAESTNGMLLLRARVPASSKVVMSWHKNRPISKIVSNAHINDGTLKVIIEKNPKHYLVSVTHP